MSTTNTINITSDQSKLTFSEEEELLLAAVAVEMVGYSGWGHGDVTRTEVDLTIEGESKWQAEINDTLLELSRGGRYIVWEEEWDDDEAGARKTVFSDGTQQRAIDKTMRLLPNDYPLLVAAVRRELDDSVDDASPMLIPAVRNLLDAIDPEVK